MHAARVVVDTNVFVAAGFSRDSHSARIVNRIREGGWRLIWNEDTRDEIEHTVDRIPVLSDDVLEGVFRDENHYDGEVDESRFDYIADPADRKFAALAVAAGIPLISSDNHLLAWRDRRTVPVLTSTEFLRFHEERADNPEEAE